MTVRIKKRGKSLHAINEGECLDWKEITSMEGQVRVRAKIRTQKKNISQEQTKEPVTLKGKKKANNPITRKEQKKGIKL